MADRGSGVVDAFDDVLEAERKLVLAGDLDGLARLAELKQGLLARLAAGPDAASLRRLRAGLDRNARLLAAAGQGVRHAIDRVRSLTGPVPPLITYDDQGRRSQIADTPPAISRNL